MAILDFIKKSMHKGTHQIKQSFQRNLKQAPRGAAIVALASSLLSLTGENQTKSLEKQTDKMIDQATQSIISYGTTHDFKPEYNRDRAHIIGQAVDKMMGEKENPDQKTYGEKIRDLPETIDLLQPYYHALSAEGKTKFANRIKELGYLLPTQVANQEELSFQPIQDTIEDVAILAADDFLKNGQEANLPPSLGNRDMRPYNQLLQDFSPYYQSQDGYTQAQIQSIIRSAFREYWAHDDKKGKNPLDLEKFSQKYAAQGVQFIVKDMLKNNRDISTLPDTMMGTNIRPVKQLLPIASAVYQSLQTNTQKDLISVLGNTTVDVMQDNKDGLAHNATQTMDLLLNPESVQAIHQNASLTPDLKQVITAASSAWNRLDDADKDNMQSLFSDVLKHQNKGFYFNNKVAHTITDVLNKGVSQDIQLLPDQLTSPQLPPTLQGADLSGLKNLSKKLTPAYLAIVKPNQAYQSMLTDQYLRYRINQGHIQSALQTGNLTELSQKLNNISPQMKKIVLDDAKQILEHHQKNPLDQKALSSFSSRLARGPIIANVVDQTIDFATRDASFLDPKVAAQLANDFIGPNGIQIEPQLIQETRHYLAQLDHNGKGYQGIKKLTGMLAYLSINGSSNYKMNIPQKEHGFSSTAIVSVPLNFFENGVSSAIGAIPHIFTNQLEALTYSQSFTALRGYIRGAVMPGETGEFRAARNVLERLLTNPDEIKDVSHEKLTEPVKNIFQKLSYDYGQMSEHDQELTLDYITKQTLNLINTAEKNKEKQTDLNGKNSEERVSSAGKDTQGEQSPLKESIANLSHSHSTLDSKTTVNTIQKAEQSTNQTQATASVLASAQNLSKPQTDKSANVMTQAIRDKLSSDRA